MTETAKQEIPDFESLAKAIVQAQRADTMIAVIAALAIEYEAGTITADRFSDRTCQLLKYYAGANK